MFVQAGTDRGGTHSLAGVNVLDQGHVPPWEHESREALLASIPFLEQEPADPQLTPLPMHVKWH
jgi:hypothetical protein